MSETLTAGWRTHGGNFTQVAADGVSSVSPYQSKWQEGGRKNPALAPLEQLYSFGSLLSTRDVYSREAEFIFGVERFFNVGNLTYAFEFYFFDDAKRIGKLTTKLVAGGKTAKRARAQATVALRANWWPEVGGQREEDYRGWVELYDPYAYETRKIDVVDIRSWAEGVVQLLGDEWRAYNGAGGPGFGTRMDSVRDFTGKVIYSANLLRDHRVPVETISAIHLREPRYFIASQMLKDIAESGSALADFDFNRLQTLYT